MGDIIVSESDRSRVRSMIIVYSPVSSFYGREVFFFLKKKNKIKNKMAYGGLAEINRRVARLFPKPFFFKEKDYL